MPKSPEEMTSAMIANMKEKTGKTLEQWVAIVGRQKLGKHGEIVKFLKGDHGVTHGFANLVAHTVLKSDAASSDAGDLIAAQYSGKKEALRPIYDALVAAAARLGKDVEIAPKKAYVSLRRSKQFAILQPSTATRFDLGLQLGDDPPSGRLEASGSFNAMVSHRVRLTSKKDVDAQVRAWLAEAYSRA